MCEEDGKAPHDSSSLENKSGQCPRKLKDDPISSQGTLILKKMFDSVSKSGAVNTCSLLLFVTIRVPFCANLTLFALLYENSSLIFFAKEGRKSGAEPMLPNEGYSTFFRLCLKIEADLRKVLLYLRYLMGDSVLFFACSLKWEGRL